MKNSDHIFLNTIVKGIPLNNTQIGLLMDIAYQCPYEGGAAVFRARAILDGIADIDFDDEILCGQDGGQFFIAPPPSGNEISNIFSIYPNPANHSVTIRMPPTTIEGDMELTIYNLYGQTLAKHVIAEGANGYSFSTDMLSQGVYLLRVSGNNESVFTSRLVIAR